MLCRWHSTSISPPPISTHLEFEIKLLYFITVHDEKSVHWVLQTSLQLQDVSDQVSEQWGSRQDQGRGHGSHEQISWEMWWKVNQCEIAEEMPITHILLCHWRQRQQ